MMKSMRIALVIAKPVMRLEQNVAVLDLTLEQNVLIPTIVHQILVLSFVAGLCTVLHQQALTISV